LLDIRNVSALEVLRDRALQIDIYFLTYLLWETFRQTEGFDVSPDVQ